MVDYVYPIIGHTIQSARRSIYIHIAVFTTLSTLVISARTYLRVSRKKWSWDDLLILLSWAAATTHSALVIEELKHGLGNHVPDIPYPDFEKIMKSFYGILLAYTLAIGTFKMSVLAQYLRIFQSQQTVRHVCYGALVFVFLFMTSFIFVSIFQCKPISYFWARATPGGVCLDPAAVWMTMNAINIATDLFIFILPLPLLHRLTFPGSMKIALMAVFALGFFVVLMSIIRMPSVYLICAGGSKDFTYYQAPSAIWTVIELNTAVICASLPSLRILGTLLAHGFLRTTRMLRTITLGTTHPSAQPLEKPSDGSREESEPSQNSRQNGSKDERAPWAKTQELAFLSEPNP